MAERVLLIKLKTTAEGLPVVAGFGRTLDDVAASENRLQREMRETASASRVHGDSLSRAASSLKGWLVAAGGVAAAGALMKQVFSYHQDVEATTNSIAGLLYANQQYVDSTGRVVDETLAWQAANGEATAVMARLQEESLKTAATVPQIADAFALTYGALAQSGQATGNLEQIITLTTRLTQTANAAKVPMEQMRQEINSILTGQVTQDSTIAHRLGLDNAAIKQLQANGNLVEELIKRTESYAKAAEAQANTVRGKLVNTAEQIVATLSKAFDPFFRKIGDGLDLVGGWFTRNGPGIITFTHRVAAGFEVIGNQLPGVSSALGGFLSNLLALAAGIGVLALIEKGFLAVKAAAIAAMTPVGKFVLGLVAIAAVWEGVRKLGDVTVGGRPIASWTSTTAQALGQAMLTVIEWVKGAAVAGWKIVQGTVTAMVSGTLRGLELIATASAKNPLVAPSLRDDASQFATWAASTREGLGTGKYFDAAVAEMERTSAKLAEIRASSVEQLSAALDDGQHAHWASLLDGMKLGLGKLIDYGKQMLPEIPGMAVEGSDIHSAGGKGGGGASSKLTEQIKKQIAEYSEWSSKLRHSVAKEGADPLARAILDAEWERDQSIMQLEAFRLKLGKAMSPEGYATDKAAIEKRYQEQIRSAGSASLEAINKKTLEETRALYELTTGLAIEGQRRARDGRIALIQDEVERERQERRASNDDWLSDQMAQIDKQYTIESEKQKAVAAVKEEYRQLNDAADAEAVRKINERTVGTAEYWKKLGEAVRQQFRGIAQIVGDTILESRATLASAINGMLDDMAQGQLDLGTSLKGLIGGLGSIWRKNLTDILMNGQNIAKQIKTMFNSIYSPRMGGPGGKWVVGTDWLGTALNGAGFGSMIGGFFQKPGNYAGEGGGIGGGVGAVVGALATAGSPIGAAIGSAIGTAIGTLIGSMIQKGEDFIKVRMAGLTSANATAPGMPQYGNTGKSQWMKIDLGNGAFFEIEDKGIDAQTRTSLATQIRRRVREELKSWQAVLDLFPQYVRDELAKMSAPQLNLTGEVVNSDITNEGAFNALGSLLNDRLPEAAFKAYSEQITRAFELMGVGDGRLEQLFERWGELQGKELQDAVRKYVTTLVETIDLRDQAMQPFETRWKEAQKRSSLTPLGQIDDLDAQIATAVASMAKLTDIDDIIAAQQRVNQLSAQRYDMEIQYLQRIQTVQQQISQSIAQQREQIAMAGMDDQGKIDLVWARMRELRLQLGEATDPETVSRLTQQIQQYVSQAMGLQGDNAEVRGKLMGILSDVDDVAKTQLEKARKEIEERDLRPATALQTAAEMLMKAAEDLSGTKKPKPEKPGAGDSPIDRPERPEPIGPRFQNDATVDALLEMRRMHLEELRRFEEVSVASAVSRDDLLDAVERGTRRAFETGRIPLDVNWTGRLENTGELITTSVETSVGTVLRILQTNPDAAVSRTAPRRAR